jgi:protein-S-isoprenylcysteine O-methyltransferase Ste14
VRHPIYAGYILAFLAALVAIPSIVTLACFLFNVALFAHAARSDERTLEQSVLAAQYGRYRRDTGMLIPRFLKYLDSTS